MQSPTLSPEEAPVIVSLGAEKKRGLWQQIISNGWCYLYLAPMLILLLTFVIYPLFASLGYMLY